MWPKQIAGATAVALAAASLMSPPSGSAADSPPQIASIQQAYQREAATIGAKHDAGLRVVGADCSRDLSGEYLCWVKYTGSADEHREVRSDVVSLRRDGSEWKLKSGLCLPAST